jgi:hypothetical protein
MTYKNWKTPTPERVRDVLIPILNSESAPAEPLDNVKREDMRGYRVLGVMNYNGQAYNMLLSENGIIKCEMNISTIFDLMETEFVDARLPIMKVYDPRNKNSSSMANFAAEPNPEKLKFLKTVGRKLAETVPGLEKIALAYQPQGQKKFVYELL